MFKLIRMIFMFCLLIGVIYFGAKIYHKSNELEMDLAEKKTQIMEKIAEIEKKAEKKKLAIEEVYQGVKDALDNGVANQKKQAPKKNASKESGRLSTKTENPETAVTLDPLDDEDRELTAELLAEAPGEKRSTEEYTQTADEKSVSSLLENEIHDKEAEEPLDLDRLTEIRDIYSKTIEELDWD